MLHMGHERACHVRGSQTRGAVTLDRALGGLWVAAPGQDAARRAQDSLAITLPWEGSTVVSLRPHCGSDNTEQGTLIFPGQKKSPLP